MPYSKEIVVEIWEDKTGECVEIGPDRDGLNLIEIRMKDINGNIASRMAFSKEQAIMVGEALYFTSNQIKSGGKS